MEVEPSVIWLAVDFVTWYRESDAVVQGVSRCVFASCYQFPVACLPIVPGVSKCVFASCYQFQCSEELHVWHFCPRFSRCVPGVTNTGVFQVSNFCPWFSACGISAHGF